MSIQQAVDAIIRPPRTTYDIKKLPRVLESDDEEDGGGLFIRIPMEIELPRDKLVIRGSIYHSGLMKLSQPGPCVVYMHGNASSQLEGQFLVPNLCPYKVFVVCFDFIGCGCSDGEFVSLGYFEKGDTEFILNFLHEKYHLGPFVLWGRSMGAATALIVDNPTVVGIVSDSGFTSIRNMVKAIARQHNVGSVFMKPTLWMLKNKIEARAHFDMNTVSPEKEIVKKTTPVIFAQATDDKLIPFDHCEKLFAAYGGKDKQIIKLTGGHNGRRPLEFIKTGVKFALERFGISTKGLIISPCRKLMKSDFHFESFDQMVGNTGAQFDGSKLCEEVAAEEDEDDDVSSQSFHIEEEEKQEADVHNIAEAFEEEEEISFDEEEEKEESDQENEEEPVQQNKAADAKDAQKQEESKEENEKSAESKEPEEEKKNDEEQETKNAEEKKE